MGSDGQEMKRSDGIFPHERVLPRFNCRTAAVVSFKQGMLFCRWPQAPIRYLIHATLRMGTLSCLLSEALGCADGEDQLHLICTALHATAADARRGELVIAERSAHAFGKWLPGDDPLATSAPESAAAQRFAQSYTPPLPARQITNSACTCLTLSQSNTSRQMITKSFTSPQVPQNNDTVVY
ncbi:hypothetical protein L209DRAFT_747116 [Thermothelomyces heterothallicus CBS 203.75]